MKRYWLHFKTITLHKWYVLKECFRVGLYYQGIVHDLSKYSPLEFFTSARYFQGVSSPVNAEKDKLGYSISWLNHKAKNKHNWHYWTDVEKGELIAVPMPEKYILEMACDFVGASKAYNKEKFTTLTPIEYYDKNKKEMIMTEETHRIFKIYLKDYWLHGKFIT
jgi:hypothetical protein